VLVPKQTYWVYANHRTLLYDGSLVLYGGRFNLSTINHESTVINAHAGLKSGNVNLIRSVSDKQIKCIFTSGIGSVTVWCIPLSDRKTDVLI